MRTLGVDTSGPLGGVALHEAGVLSEALAMDTPLSHAERLFWLIDEVLDRCHVRKHQIDLVCVNRGPGSFTGLRIGLAATKGLCQSLSIPLRGVDGMEVHRHRVADESRVCVVVASRRDLFYVRWFGRGQNDATHVVHEDELVRHLAADPRPVCLVGQGAERLGLLLPMARNLRIEPEIPSEIYALAVAEFGTRNDEADQLYSVEPLYVEPLLIGGSVL